MQLSQQEQAQAAREFATLWAGRGDEKSDTQSFWLMLLQNVFGVENAERFIEFEKRVQLGHTSFIDAYIQSTLVLIEQKSIDINLRTSAKQSDSTMLDPFGQAHRYASHMKRSESPRWIVTCNFKSFLVYDMENPSAPPEEILLENLEKEFYRLSFLASAENIHLKREMELSIQAGEIVGQIYDKLLSRYKNKDSELTLKSLNVLCVRLVFCLYAEDAGLFATKSQFHDYLEQFPAKQLRSAIIELFEVLNTPQEYRDKYLDPDLAAFPYVNGGLFSDEDISIPQFDEELRTLLLQKASEDFDWSDISPTIFGAVFESTLNPDTRRSGGMHYTSIENIHKVIDPLFMDALKNELEQIKKIDVLKDRQNAIAEFQKKIASIKFFDPACGSGNFLTESYLSLSKLEIEALEATKGRGELFVNGQSLVSINQFYGIEINDFAVTVAKTALWIAESQVCAKMNEILMTKKPFLPLHSYTNIVEGNALRMDWREVIGTGYEVVGCSNVMSSVVETSTTDNLEPTTYIMGNPPFVGHQWRNAEQKADMDFVFDGFGNYGKLDYVACWYKKSYDFVKGTKIKCAFVSTNSITQGESVGVMWKPLFELGLQIDFAYQTFKWNSESTDQAAVHCVIIGFSCHTDLESANAASLKAEGKSLDFPNPCDISKTVVISSAVEKFMHKIIFDSDGNAHEAQNINGYLLDAPNVFIENRGSVLTKGLPKMSKGSQPTDGGNLILSEAEKQDLINKYPQTEKFIKRFIGADDFINNKFRYCLWLKDVNPAEYLKIKPVMERIEKVRQMRLQSPTKSVQRDADTPMLFTQIRQPESDYLLVPRVSSENRKYIPMGFLSKEIIVSDATQFIPDASLYLFGILISAVHMAWMRVVAGRLKSDYRYTPAVYNNFPWPCLGTGYEVEGTTTDNPVPTTCERIASTAQAILDSRAKYADSSLGEMYSNLLLYPELNKAHQANDKAVLAAYGWKQDISETEIVAKLMALYQAMER